MFNWIMDGGELTPGIEFGPGWHLLEQGGAVPGNRYEHTLTTLNDRLHLVGGYNDASVLNQHVGFTPSEGQWGSYSAPGSRQRHTVTELNGLLYLVGGLTGSSAPSATASVRRYDPATNTWTNCANLHAVRWGHGAALHDGRLYVHAGRDSSRTNTNTLYRYDPDTNAWAKPLAAGGAAGNYHRLVAHGDHLYQLATNGQLWRYSIIDNSWTQLPSAPRGTVIGCSWVAYGGYLWLWGGSGDYPRDLWRYDPTTETWAKMAVPGTLPPGRYYHATALWGSRLVIHGGRSGDVRYNDLWLLDLAQLV